MERQMRNRGQDLQQRQADEKQKIGSATRTGKLETEDRISNMDRQMRNRGQDLQHGQASEKQKIGSATWTGR